MFETHLLNEKGLDEVAAFKTLMVQAMKEVLPRIPEGREQSIFKTKVEEAVFFATKAIASKEGNYTEIRQYGI